MLTREYLVEVRRQALRRHIWYKTLDNIERSIFSLSITVCKKIQSNLLNNQLLKIVVKIKKTLKSVFLNHLESFGISRIKMIQKQAIVFGYNGASELKLDYNFIRYLVFLDYNQPIVWRMCKS